MTICYYKHLAYIPTKNVHLTYPERRLSSIGRWRKTSELVSQSTIFIRNHTDCMICTCGETGRRARFRIWYRKMCRFKSYQVYHPLNLLKSVGTSSKAMQPAVDGALPEAEMSIAAAGQSMCGLQSRGLRTQYTKIT